MSFVIERDMSFKLEISAVKGPTEMLAMSRISVELDNTALHVAAACLDCTPLCGTREDLQTGGLYVTWL